MCAAVVPVGIYSLTDCSF